MVLNEADSGAACRRGARTRETQLLPRGHGPGSAPLSEMSSPRHRASAPLLPESISPAPACRRLVWGSTWSVWGLWGSGALPQNF